ncbi:MAG: outer membrane beta-barrel protein, partial [Thermoanaerobaculia bacterium]
MTRSLRTKSAIVSAFAFALVMLCAGSAIAQTAARFEGVVTDKAGGVLPGVTITSTNLGTNQSRTEVTDSKGAYTITPLTVGNYRLQFELGGFKTVSIPVTLSVGQVSRVDMKMELGGVSETMTVVATAPVIDKSTSQISTLIDTKMVQDLPLNGRNFTQLATLAPGVNRGIPGSNSAGQGGQAETFRYSEFGGAALSVNGLREQFNNFLIEGLDNNETLVNTIAYLPSPEAIQEFSVITTNAPAEYGRAGGAIQNLVIKSGTNQFKGSLYYFDRPRSLAAKPKFADTKPDFNNKDYGLTLGGPVFRDRTFFFASYHGLKNSIPVEAGNYVAVPTAKMRNGDFSELLDPAVSGLSRPIIIYNPLTGQPFPGNIIPANMINPVGQKYLNVFPLPTRAGVQHNYLTHRQRQSTYNDFDGKLDQTITSADQFFLNGSHWSDQFNDPGRIPGYQAGFGSGTADNKGYAARLGESHLFSNNLINEARGGYTDFQFGFLPVGFGTDQDKAIGIPGTGGITTANGISLIGGGDGSYIEYLGDFGQYIIKQRTLQLSDAVTYLTGAHSFKFGGTAMRRNMYQQRSQIGKGFYFYNDALSGPNGPGLGLTGYEVSDMLAAKTNFTAAGTPGYVPRNVISWEDALFAQDDWHLRSNLTLNLGMRWDLFTPYYEENNKMANFDPATGKLVLPDQNGASRSTLKTNYDNFGPRLGFNYLLND